jgi:hypothetical protein
MKLKIVFIILIGNCFISCNRNKLEFESKDSVKVDSIIVISNNTDNIEKKDSVGENKLDYFPIQKELNIQINDSISILLEDYHKSWCSMNGKPFDSTFSSNKIKIKKFDSVIYSDTVNEFWFYKKIRYYPVSFKMDSLLAVPVERFLNEVDGTDLIIFLIGKKSFDTIPIPEFSGSDRYSKSSLIDYIKEK